MPDDDEADEEAEKEERRRQKARFEDRQRREDDRREDDRQCRYRQWSSGEKRAQERRWAWATTKTLLHIAERVLYESLTGMFVSPRSRPPFPALNSLQFPRLFSLVPLADLN